MRDYVLPERQYIYVCLEDKSVFPQFFSDLFVLLDKDYLISNLKIFYAIHIARLCS